MGNQPLKPIKDGQLLLRPMTDYYTYVKFLGRGRNGSVDLFKSKINNKEYAIKIIPTASL